MTNQLEMVNGVLSPMSDANQAAYNSLQTKFAAEQQNFNIKKQIVALESTQTMRRMREALKDPTWLNALDSQIAALRAQLT